MLRVVIINATNDHDGVAIFKVSRQINLLPI